MSGLAELKNINSKMRGGAGSAFAPTVHDELPAVTEDDNGSVLTVVDGAWDKADGCSGGAFVVDVSYNQSGLTTTYTMDKTYAEILSAVNSGVRVVIQEDDMTGGVGSIYFYSLIKIRHSVGEEEWFFVSVASISGNYCEEWIFRTEDENGYPTFVREPS